jgi:hypothetical protein
MTDECISPLRRRMIEDMTVRVLDWHWIIEDHHHTVASVSFERAVVLYDDFADGRMVVA